jgi:predicted DNA-binding transcriptional regulator AlpA
MGKLLTLEQTAEMINRPESTLRYWVLQDMAPKSFKLGRRRMFREEDVVAWIDEKAEASA